jgi:hypothetical protein
LYEKAAYVKLKSTTSEAFQFIVGASLTTASGYLSDTLLQLSWQTSITNAVLKFDNRMAYCFALYITAAEAIRIQLTDVKNPSSIFVMNANAVGIAIPDHFESSGISGLLCQISGNSGIFSGISLYSINLFQNSIYRFILRRNLLSSLLQQVP